MHKYMASYGTDKQARNIQRFEYFGLSVALAAILISCLGN